MKNSKHLTIVIKLGEFLYSSSRYESSAKCFRNSGTSSIVDEKSHEPLLSILSLICETAVKLHKDGHKVIIVSSGAIGVALRMMDLDKRPKHLPRVQVRPEYHVISFEIDRNHRLWQPLDSAN
jgi:precorrin-3B methylase